MLITLAAMRPILLLTLAFTCTRVPSLLGATATSPSTAQILRDLKSLPQGVGWPQSHYYDMHGNANRGLQALMIRRFEATSALCREIDSVSFELHPAYVASLYRVLGTVKDPASIPWLEHCLKGPKRKEIYDHWLSEWRAYLRGAAPTELTWVAGTNEWSKFFRAWATLEMSETNRLSVLRVMQGWLHDPPTQAFFESLERDGKATDEEVLLAQVYLRQHGRPFNEAKLRAITIKLRKTPNGARVLLRYAAAIRSEALVDWAKNLMRGWDFFARDTTTWEEYVRTSNMHV